MSGIIGTVADAGKNANVWVKPPGVVGTNSPTLNESIEKVANASQGSRSRETSPSKTSLPPAKHINPKTPILNNKAKIEQLNNEKKALEEQVQLLTEQSLKAAAENESHRKMLESITDECEELSNQLENREKSLQTLREEQPQLKQKIEELKAQIAHTEELSQKIQAMEGQLTQAEQLASKVQLLEKQALEQSKILEETKAALDAARKQNESQRKIEVTTPDVFVEYDKLKSNVISLKTRLTGLSKDLVGASTKFNEALYDMRMMSLTPVAAPTTAPTPDANKTPPSPSKPVEEAPKDLNTQLAEIKAAKTDLINLHTKTEEQRKTFEATLKECKEKQEELVDSINKQFTTLKGIPTDWESAQKFFAEGTNNLDAIKKELGQDLTMNGFASATAQLKSVIDGLHSKDVEKLLKINHEIFSTWNACLSLLKETELDLASLQQHLDRTELHTLASMVTALSLELSILETGPGIKNTRLEKYDELNLAFQEIVKLNASLLKTKTAWKDERKEMTLESSGLLANLLEPDTSVPQKNKEVAETFVNQTNSQTKKLDNLTSTTRLQITSEMVKIKGILDYISIEIKQLCHVRAHVQSWSTLTTTVRDKRMTLCKNLITNHYFKQNQIEPSQVRYTKDDQKEYTKEFYQLIKKRNENLSEWKKTLETLKLQFEKESKLDPLSKQPLHREDISPVTLNEEISSCIINEFTSEAIIDTKLREVHTKTAQKLKNQIIDMNAGLDAINKWITSDSEGAKRELAILGYCLRTGFTPSGSLSSGYNRSTVYAEDVKLFDLIDQDLFKVPAEEIAAIDSWQTKTPAVPTIQKPVEGNTN